MPELFNSECGQPSEAAAAHLAGSQFGRLSVQQLNGLGFTNRQIDWRVNTGRWTREYRGVIRLGPETPDYRGRCWAAQLAYGPDAVISHDSAGAIWEVRAYLGPVHATLPQRRSSRRGTIAHESRSLGCDEVRIQFGLRVTNPLRTLVDLADTLTTDELERALSEAHRIGYLDLPSLDPLSTPGRKGLVKVLARGARMTRSQLEALLLSDLRAAKDLTQPEVNARIGPYEADFYWPGFGLVLELDTYRTHGDRRTFERDREKQTFFALRGIVTMRVTEETVARAVADVRAFNFKSDRAGRL